MKYSLLTLLLLSSLLLAGCGTPLSSTPSETNPIINTPSEEDDDQAEDDDDDTPEEDDNEDSDDT